MFRKCCTDYHRYMRNESVDSKVQPKPRKIKCDRCDRMVKTKWVKQSGTMWGGEPGNTWFLYILQH